MKTLKLFNAVLSPKIILSIAHPPFISEDGYIIEPNAVWAKDRIIEYYKKEKLSGNELNKTFHKSWLKIKESSRLELFIGQIQHYISTYGSNFKDEIYIPNEVLDVPDLKLTYKVIKAYSKEELTNKCLSLLKSGIALKEETITDILSVLTDELKYKFTGKEKIKNKEAVIKIADLYNILPSDTMEFFRYIIYRSTGQSLLIKNKEMIELIKASNYNPTIQFGNFGLKKLSEIFNRFKPLFLAFKKKCPATINKIAKLSKKYHKPLVQNPLNNVTNKLLDIEDLHWLDNATIYALFKALSACHTRKNGQDSFVYRIRNGKSWTKENKSNNEVCEKNLSVILHYLKTRINLKGKKVYIPNDIKFALPTSEKMFVGNIPTGTKFYGEKLAAGIYWKDSWGARDLDLSGMNENGKIGWNSSYNQKGELLFSGDLTSAPNGAVEYVYANKGLKEPTLVLDNVYNGKDESSYKIIVGTGDEMSRDYMMNPNNLLLDVKCNSVQKQTILGIFLPEEKRQSFVLLNFGAGHARVSGNSEMSRIAIKALLQQWSNSITLNTILLKLGAKIVDSPDNVDFDFSLDKLTKDSFIEIFSTKTNA